MLKLSMLAGFAVFVAKILQPLIKAVRLLWLHFSRKERLRKARQLYYELDWHEKSGRALLMKHEDANYIPVAAGGSAPWAKEVEEWERSVEGTLHLGLSDIHVNEFRAPIEDLDLKRFARDSSARLRHRLNLLGEIRRKVGQRLEQD